MSQSAGPAPSAVRTLVRQMPQRDRTPSQVWAWDIESYGLNPSQPIIISMFNFSASDSIQTWVGTGSRREARQFIDSLHGRHIFYAHRGNSFDIYSLFDMGELVAMRKLAGGTSVYEFRYPTARGGLVHFRDSSHLLPVPLSALGAKGETPEKFTNPDDPAYGDPSAIEDADIWYCEQDVRVLAAALADLRDSYREWTGIMDADLPMTSASLAYRVWCARSWPASWNYNGKDRVSFPMAADHLARRAYFGGRVEVLDGLAGEVLHDVFSVDRNSMFPAEMMSRTFPDPNRLMQKSPTVGNLRDLIRRGLPFWAEVRMRAKQGADLFLPQVMEKKLRFNHDRFEGALMWPEIIRALNNGWVLEGVGELWFSVTQMRPFQDHVSTFYDLRLDMKRRGDGRELFVKIGPLNSLYGKFGSKDRCERVEDVQRLKEIVKNPAYLEEWDEYLWNIYDPTHYYLISKNATIQPRCVFTAWAAGVTSYARCVQADTIQAFRTAGFSPCYTDTDSVHVHGTPDLNIGDLPITIGSGLGEWDFEFADGWERPAPWAVYWERKAYTWRMGDATPLRIKHKGARDSDGDLRKPQTHIRVMQYREAMRRRMPAGMQMTEVKRSRTWCK